MTASTVDIAADNDIVLKAVAYGLTAFFWPGPQARLGLLGAARYVIPAALEKHGLVGDVGRAKLRFDALWASAERLEPGEPELRLAAEIEAGALQAGLPLDRGESQLAAMTMERAIPSLETGDKRAIRSLESLRGRTDALERLDGRVRCLEQVMAAALAETSFSAIAAAVCAEPSVDRALNYCFTCSSGSAVHEAHRGLQSYISRLRSEAPNMLSLA